MEDSLRGSAFIAQTLRGLLARPASNEDDPFERVLLAFERGETGTPGAMVLEESEIASLAEDPVPEALVIRGVGTYSVSRGKPSEARPLEDKVALVTGAAGAIGAGIVRGLLAKGARVAAADLSREGLDSLTAEFEGEFPGRLLPVEMDVTAEASVAAGFDSASLRWGGVDIVIPNAGLAAVATLAEMDVERFRLLERVNVEGTLHTLGEAGRVFKRQGTGGDIVLVSTKNVFCPGASFGAYSATKAAAHQLARIASLEFAPLGVRVNMVAPDAVFSDGARRSGLWAEVGPSRMKARGLDEAGLEDYYRSRNLLKSRVTPAHVANAVLFFATRQTPTTGATIPVDGGLPDSTPR